MTFQEALKKEKRWNKRVFIINLYHKSMLLKRNGKWNMRRSAKKLGISLGQVSESIKIANAIIAQPELEILANRIEALKAIK